MAGRTGRRQPSRVIAVYFYLDEPQLNEYIEMTQLLSRTLAFEGDFEKLQIQAGDQLLQGRVVKNFYFFYTLLSLTKKYSVTSARAKLIKVV